MTVSIVEIRPASDEEWDSIWAQTTYATYFHSREWAEIFSSYTAGKVRPAPKLVSFSDGAKALLPLSVEAVARGLVKCFLSSPAGTFGGWLSTNQLQKKHADLITNILANKIENLVWRINPYDPLLSEISIAHTIHDETQVLNLTPGFDEVFRNWTKGHSSAVRKATKVGVTVIRAMHLHEFETYFEIYQDSLRRWGDKASSVYSWALFREIFDRKSKNIILWLAMYKGSPIAGSLCFYSNNKVVYWHGAALEKHFDTRPVNLLMYEAIKHACDLGYTWFDFNPSGDHKGVLAFKRSFGTEAKPCPLFIRRSWKLALTRALTHGLGL